MDRDYEGLEGKLCRGWAETAKDGRGSCVEDGPRLRRIGGKVCRGWTETTKDEKQTCEERSISEMSSYYKTN